MFKLEWPEKEFGSIVKVLVAMMEIFFKLVLLEKAPLSIVTSFDLISRFSRPVEGNARVRIERPLSTVMDTFCN